MKGYVRLHRSTRQILSTSFLCPRARHLVTGNPPGPSLCSHTGPIPWEHGKPTSDRGLSNHDSLAATRFHSPPAQHAPAPSPPLPIPRKHGAVCTCVREAGLTHACASPVLALPGAHACLPRPTLVGQVWQWEGSVIREAHTIVEAGNQESDILENKGHCRTQTIGPSPI